MTNVPRDSRLSAFDAVVADGAVASRLRDVSHSAYTAASEFWRVPLEAEHLTPRMCELILLAMHATPTALNVDGIRRHVRRAAAAGATDADIIDVLFTISAVANHAL